MSTFPDECWGCTEHANRHGRPVPHYEPSQLYRCFDCGMWLCKPCTKDHFGNQHQPHPMHLHQWETKVAELEAKNLDMGNTLLAIGDPDDYESGGPKTLSLCQWLAEECVERNRL